VRAQVFLAAGVMRMPAIKFLMADAASAILTVTLMVGIGYLCGNSIEALTAMTPQKYSPFSRKIRGLTYLFFFPF
jgi:membrane protein DedA with SNARE-associated domain